MTLSGKGCCGNLHPKDRIVSKNANGMKGRRKARWNYKMTDHISPEHRSWNMSQIKCKDTKIEVQVRSWLFSKGFRFRKNDKRYPGKPDIVLPKYKTVIFINGCFWHRHEGCKYATTPKTKTDYWLDKFERNVKNDELHRQQLEEMGWQVITIWECQLKKSVFDSTMNRIEFQLRKNEEIRQNLNYNTSEKYNDIIKQSGFK